VLEKERKDKKKEKTLKEGYLSKVKVSS